MEKAREKVLSIISQNYKKAHSYLNYLQSKLEVLRVDFRNVVEIYVQSGIEAFAFIVSRGGFYDRSDIWVEFIKGIFCLLAFLIIAILVYILTKIFFVICKCVLINAMSLIIQLSSKKTIVIKLFRLIMLIIYVFFCVITYYSFFLFCYLPSKFLLIKGMVRFINIFNMHIPFA